MKRRTFIISLGAFSLGLLCLSACTESDTEGNSSELPNDSKASPNEVPETQQDVQQAPDGQPDIGSTLLDANGEIIRLLDGALLLVG